MRALGLTLGHQHVGHAVVQARHDWKSLERLLINALGLGMLATLVHQAAQRRIHPRLRTAGENALEELFQLVEAVEISQSISPVTQAQGRETRVLFAQLGARCQHFGRAATVQGLKDRLEQGLALRQLVEALGQAYPVERFGQVGIGLVLQGAEHDGLAALGGHHDEHALMADQLVEDHVLQHLLAVLFAIPKVEILKNVVIALLPAHAQGLLTAVGSVDVTHAQLAQHGARRRAKVGEVIDDQKALLPVLQHQHDLYWMMGGWRAAMHAAETCIGSQAQKMRAGSAAA